MRAFCTYCSANRSDEPGDIAAIPDLDDHQKVFALLPAEQELGLRLSPAYQLIPEQSTAAIIVHHPEAKYYTVGGSRVEQLERERMRP